MNRVKAVYNHTIEILKLLNEHKLASKDREQLLQQLNQLILEREQLINALETPYSESEKEIGKKIIPLNNQLEKEMEILFGHIKGDMKKMKQNKDLNYSYIRPYGKLKTTDGMYIDSKL